MKIKSLIAATFFAAAMLASAAHAQVMQLGPGEVISNATASQARGTHNSLSATFNRGFCSTPSAMLVNVAGTWACVSQLALTQLPTLGADTVLGSVAGGTPIALSQAQLTALCNVFSTSLSGCVNAPGSVTGKVLGDDGNWHTQPGTGTVTGLTAGQGCTSGTGGQTQITVSGTINCPTGSSNKLRNSSLSSWFHGSGVAITTSGGWGAEGIFIVPTGASVTSNRVTANATLPDSFAQQQIVGNTSVTDVVTRFVVESLDAAALSGQQVTFQMQVINNTGASITPTLTVKRATAQDATYTATDVSAASLQTIANGATGTLSYSWAAPSGTVNGISIDVDFGNNFSSNAKSIIIGGGFDCHVTPGVSTGTVSAPPVPEIRSVAEDLVWNQRFYATNYPSGTAPGTATHSGMVYAGFVISGFVSAAAIQFPTQMRAAPSVSYWDGAGNASKVSHAATAGSAITFTDNIAASVAPTDISATGFLVSGDGTNANTTSFVNYAADATLVGG